MNKDSKDNFEDLSKRSGISEKKEKSKQLLEKIKATFESNGNAAARTLKSLIEEEEKKPEQNNSDKDK